MLRNIFNHQMLRMHGSMQEWTTMQRTEITRKMTKLINENIDKVPSEMSMPDESRSLQMVSEGAILNIRILKHCLHRTAEYCAVEESQWTCWQKCGLLVLQQRSLNAENYSACTYYEKKRQKMIYDKGEDGALAAILAACKRTLDLCQSSKRTNK